MDHYGFWSILPPVIAIALAIKTKQVYIALLFGIWLGWIIISGGDFIGGTFDTVEALVAVFQEPSNTRTIIFSALVGALIVFIQRSGGVEGFIEKVNHLLMYFEKKKKGKSRMIIQLFTFATGMLIFVESSISVLTIGALYRPVFDKLKISREKLAYLADSSSAPSCILIPFNAWGAYIMTLLAAQGFDQPFGALFKAFPYNFYPFLAILVAIAVIASQKDFGPMKKAEHRVKAEGKILPDGAQPMVSSDITLMETKEGIKPRALNMILPILTMVLMMPVMLAVTGWNAIDTVNLSFFPKVFRAIGQGSGSSSVLYAVITSLLVCFILYRSQKIMKTGEMVDLALKGIGGLMPLALVMVMAFAIGNVCNTLGTGFYVAEVSRSWLTPHLVPVIVFVVSCFIAFATGTSWGTFAIMIAIAVPMAETLNTNIYLTIGAALGGGIFGDHCSPISDTTILSSMASACDHIDHVKTQLPYALFAGFMAAVMYLIVGFW